MRIKEYRGAPFVDREREEAFFVRWFNRVPQRILWVYGPKSSGKTTLIEYVIENHLLKERNFWIKYFNLRETFISSYGSFLDAFFVEADKPESEKTGIIGINLFGFKSEVWQKIKEKKLNLFKEFKAELERIRRNGKKCVIIIDEIQKLRDVYMENNNGERELLKEFLNFCVRLTKETHLSHVVILTSNTVFIETIYNDAKMKKTSEFLKIGHLNKEQVEEWLKTEKLSKEEINLIWNYYGGCIADILKAIEVKKEGENLKEFLKQEAWLAYTEIDEFLAKFSDEEVEFFKDIAKEIIKKGYYSIRGLKEKERKFLQKWAEKEILFYEPLELKVSGNSRIYEKGMEYLFEENDSP